MKGDRFAYSSFDTDTTVVVEAAHLHGICLISHTTGDVRAIVYDASATATGSLIFGGAVTGGTNNSKCIMLNGAVACHAGIHVDVACTSGADRVIVYYSPAK